MSCENVSISFCQHASVYEFACVGCGEVSPEFPRFLGVSEKSAASWPRCRECKDAASSCALSLCPNASHLYTPEATVRPFNGVICGGRTPRRRCYHCDAFGAELQCDGPPRRRNTKTCDRWLCRKCAVHVPPDFDFCRDCQRQRQVLATNSHAKGATQP